MVLRLRDIKIHGVKAQRYQSSYGVKAQGYQSLCGVKALSSCGVKAQRY